METYALVIHLFLRDFSKSLLGPVVFNLKFNYGDCNKNRNKDFWYAFLYFPN